MEWLFCWGEERISARAVRDAALLEERWISDRSVGTGMCWRRSGSQIEPLELGLLEEKLGPDRAVVPAVWGEETWILGGGVKAVVSLKEKWISDGAAVFRWGRSGPQTVRLGRVPTGGTWIQVESQILYVAARANWSSWWLLTAGRQRMDIWAATTGANGSGDGV